MYYTPLDYRGEFWWLVFRSFWQGFSKRVMELLYHDAQGNESPFLKDLFVRGSPSRAKRTVVECSTKPAKEAVAILAFTSAWDSVISTGLRIGTCYVRRSRRRSQTRSRRPSNYGLMRGMSNGRLSVTVVRNVAEMPSRIAK